MPTVAQIENADPITASQAARLLAAIRASQAFRDNRAAYPDVDAKVKARINRRAVITGANNTSPILIIADDHGFEDDELVTVQDVLGNAAANGVWLVTSATPNTFQLTGSTGDGAYTSGGEALDLISQQLSALVDALDEIGDGTVGVKGGRQGVDYSQTRDREALIAEVLDALYDVEDAGAIVAVGQRDYPERFCSSCGCKYYAAVCSCTSVYA